MNNLFKNPISIWLKWYLKNYSLLRKNKSKHLKIGYMSNVHNVSFGKYNTIYNFVSISNTIIGDYVYITDNAQIENATIGNFCSIGPNVRIGLPMHPINYLSTFPAFFSTRNQCQVSFADKDYFTERGLIKIGNDVWIGSNVLIMDNITVGDGAIIGAGALVTKDVEPYSIVGGVPAKCIKYRFSEDTVKELLELKWWEKDIETILRYRHLFNKADFKPNHFKN